MGFIIGKRPASLAESGLFEYNKRQDSKEWMQMKLTMLGTGNAAVTACYNTCFVLEEKGQYFLVDGGGGNTLLRQLQRVGIDWRKLRTVFVTHKHIDHILGIIWLMRLICQGMARGEYEGEAVIYGHGEVIELLRDMAGKLLQAK